MRSNMDYELVFSKRNTISITVDRGRAIVVRAPEGTDPDRIKSMVESKKRWIFNKLRHPQKYNDGLRKKEFVSGESVLYLGRNYRLEVENGGDESIRFIGKFIITGVTSERANKLFKEWYTQKAKEKIIPRVNYHARDMGVRFNEIMVSGLKFRWGSCTSKNSLNFSWKLIKAPMYVVDYVIVHELAHLLEHNHTSSFWNIVQTQVPGYLKAKGWLKEHGEILEYNF